MAWTFSARGGTQSIVGALRSQLHGGRSDEVGGPAAGRPFVTISRQTGAGAHSLAEHLAERLNAAGPEPRWQCFDRELIEKVARDHGLDADLVASLPDRPHSLLADLASGLRFDKSRPTDEYVYGKVVMTIRAVAKLGHAVIVGRGGVYCTQDLPGGVHVQLIAPLPHRVANYAAYHNLSERDAEAQVKRFDEQKREFYRRFWPGTLDAPDRFAMILNTDRVTIEQQADLILRLLADAGARASR
jgi:cytidylate kinase